MGTRGETATATKTPCVLTEFTFFHRIQIAIAGPLAATTLLVLGGVAVAARKRRRKARVLMRQSAVRRSRARFWPLLGT